MKLSLILCSRNDNYQGNSRWRLETALEYVGARVAELGRAADVEVIVADWGSDVPLGDTIPLTAAASQIVSFLWVPPAVARARQKDSPFPEVLALNAAARRASGDFIGRIDQDTLVGSRFLRYFFDRVEARQTLEDGTPADSALFFANRRSVPYRFVELTPTLPDLDRFIHRFGSRLDVWRQNAATGHVFWTSYVGIWLAHRRLWEKAGGYDERMIYYNWMETDLICRLRPDHPVVDLGTLTGQDFYHLEHNPPMELARIGRPHGRNNPKVDLAAPPPAVHPNGDQWGLEDVPLTLSRGTRTKEGHERSLPWPFLLAGLAGSMAVDRVSVMALRRARALRRLAGKGLPEALARTGLLATVRRLRLRSRLFSDPNLRQIRREDFDRFSWFSREATGAIRASVTGSPSGRTALVVSSRCPTIEAELCLIKALQLAGLTPVVLLENERRGLAPFYEMAGVRKVWLWSDFITSRNLRGEAAATVLRCGSIDALMKHSFDGIRVGVIAVCTALRRTRVGVLEWSQPNVRRLLSETLAASMCAVLEARAILGTIKPDVVLTPPEYTPHAELFESCLAGHIDTIAHDQAHRSDAVVFKRYTIRNRDRHLTTLSDESWKTMQDLEWTEARAGQLNAEMSASYRAGDWYGTPWVADAPTSAVDVKRVLGVNGRPVAAIFPHMLWDAPVMWGRPVFATYQDWLVETVRAAYQNPGVNWIVKIHPAHVRKQAPGRNDEPAEVSVLRDALGPFPAHVRCLPPDTPLSTSSLLTAVDYCFTVRGTVGVEAARLGVPVFTAGPARYSGLGFTIDSNSQEEYLERVAALQGTPPLSESARRLAERYAYGLFVLRPLTITSTSRDREVPDRVRITLRSGDEWKTAPDVSALARWFASRDEDFLHPL